MKYHILQEGNQVSEPKSIEEIKALLNAGLISAETKVCAEVASEWRSVSKVLEQTKKRTVPASDQIKNQKDEHSWSQRPRAFLGCLLILIGLLGLFDAATTRAENIMQQSYIAQLKTNSLLWIILGAIVARK